MNQIYQQAAKETEYSPQQIKAVMDHTFAWLRLQMTDVTHNKVLINGLGTFKLLESKMRKALKSKRLSQEDRKKTEQLLEKFFKTNNNETR